MTIIISPSSHPIPDLQLLQGLIDLARRLPGGLEAQLRRQRLQVLRANGLGAPGVPDRCRWRRRGGETMGKPWETHGKTMGKPGENHGKTR